MGAPKTVSTQKVSLLLGMWTDGFVLGALGHGQLCCSLTGIAVVNHLPVLNLCADPRTFKEEERGEIFRSKHEGMSEEVRALPGSQKPGGGRR